MFTPTAKDKEVLEQLASVDTILGTMAGIYRCYRLKGHDVQEALHLTLQARVKVICEELNTREMLCKIDLVQLLKALR